MSVDFHSQKELNLDSAVPDISPDQVIALKSFFSNDDDPNDDTVTWKDIYRQLDTTIVWTTKASVLLFRCCIELCIK